MKIHRFYIPVNVTEVLKNNREVQIVLQDNDEYFEADEFIHQLTHVLRFKSGDMLHVFNNTIGEFLVSIMSFNKKALLLKLENEIQTIKNEMDLDITLAMSLIKKDKFELVVEKATELGVKDIIPMVTERVVQKNIGQDRLLRIVKEASEQSGRVSIPKMSNTESFTDILKKTKDYDLSLYGNMTGETSFIDLDERFRNDGIKSIMLFIGPEGGWTEGEVKMFVDAGVKSISIHKNTLRAETAAIGVLGFLGGWMGN